MAALVRHTMRLGGMEFGSPYPPSTSSLPRFNGVTGAEELNGVMDPLPTFDD